MSEWWRIRLVMMQILQQAHDKWQYAADGGACIWRIWLDDVLGGYVCSSFDNGLSECVSRTLWRVIIVNFGER